MKHRKLFLTFTDTNSTKNCSGFCDPPPPLTAANGSTSAQNLHISPHLIVLGSFLSIFFILVCYYVIRAKSCGGCCTRSNNRAETGNSDEEFIDENGSEHPVWFIASVGLQQSVINSISVRKYKKGEGLIEVEGTECSVCLSEFQEEEMLRLLPKCHHAFHTSCIDTWLRSHTNCPICRAGIVFDGIRTVPVMARDRNSSGRTGDDEIRVEDGNEEVSESRGGTGDVDGVLEGKEKLVRSISMDSSASSPAKEDDRRLIFGARSFSCNGRLLSSKTDRSLNANLPL